MIMEILPILNQICKAMALILGVLYFYQIVYLVLPIFRNKKKLADQPLRRYAILIAARNEECVIPHLLDSIRNQDYPSQLLTTYVIADNCTDHTAQVAAEHGAVVYERFDQMKIGKGYALQFLLSQIQKDAGWNSYDAFLIFDADNLLRPDYVTEINKVCGAGYEAFCGYRNTKNFGTNWLSAGYGVWYLHDSAHLNQSRMMLGTSCAVSGTGFGFTRELLERMGGWNFFTLTEDIEFDTWCVTHGVKIGYCHDAITYDEQPFDFRQSWRQRTRWTQGGIQIAARYSGAMLKGLFQGGWASYATFETATLSMWGCGLSIVCGGLTLTLALLTGGGIGLLKAICFGILSGYSSAAAMGALTVFSEWKRIAAPGWKKAASIFAFPLFLLTFVPIALCAIFRKFQWQPIKHTVAVSGKALSKELL